MAELNYREAVAYGIAQEMRRDPNLVMLGEDIAAAGGVFKTTVGLVDEFGPDRVRDTPISEQALLGAAMGAAMTGVPVIAEIMFSDFLAVCWDIVANEIAKSRYMSNGQVSFPLVIKSGNGGGLRFGAQHSQAIQGLLLGVPGLKIVMPSTPYDAKGLLLSAILDNNPVCVFEHRWLMKKDGVVPDGFYRVPLGKGTYRRRGDDVTIVGASHAIELGLQAATQLETEGIGADVIDLRTIKPMDEQIILESLQKTGRVVAVDTAWMKGGVCAEIGCLAAEKGFRFLKAPVARVGLPDIPTPAGYTLEQYFYPDAARIAAAARSLLR